MATTSLLGPPSSSPFSPHFGGAPAALVGRDDILAEIGGGLVTGPNDPRYVSIILGARGAGKTVLLGEIEERAAQEGWIILSLDAGTSGLLERIAHAVSQAEDAYEPLQAGDPPQSTTVEKSLRVKVGPLEGKVVSTDYREYLQNIGLRDQLTRLADAASRNGTAVLLTVDELQGIDRGEGRRLANDLQHITRREELPLAFLGAGLLELKYTLMRDSRMTFFHRCEQFELTPLSVPDSLVGLVQTVEQAGGKIASDAAMLAAKAVNGSPYRLQIIGDIAWRTAGAPETEIGKAAVELAITASEDIVDSRVRMPAWYDLAESDRQFLSAIIGAGQVDAALAAKRTGLNEKSANGFLRRLCELGYFSKVARGLYEFTDLLPAEEALDLPSGQGERDAPASANALCREWMPRAKAYCILRAGHPNGCRSRQ